MQKDGLEEQEWIDNINTYSDENLDINIKKMLKSDPNLLLIDLGENEVLQAYCNGEYFDFLQSTFDKPGEWDNKLYQFSKSKNKYSEKDINKTDISDATMSLLGCPCKGKKSVVKTGDEPSVE